MNNNVERWRRAGNSYEISRGLAAQEVAPPKTVGGATFTITNPHMQQLIAAPKLEAFLRSEDGQAALYLLARAQKVITLYSENDGGGIQCVAYLGGDGLRDGHEARRSESLLYVSEEERNRRLSEESFKPMDVHTALKRAYDPNFGFAAKPTQNDPSKFLEWLRGEIDKIAVAAPTSTITTTSAA